VLSLIKPSGWAFGETLFSDQMEALDASQAKAIDGTGGGTYTPTTKITINGQGLQVNNLTVTGALTLNGNTTIGNSSTDTLTVVATAGFSAPVTLDDTFRANDTSDFYGNVVVHTGSSFHVFSGAAFGTSDADEFDVNATARFFASVRVDGAIDVYGEKLELHTGTDFSARANVRLGDSSANELTVNALLANPLGFTGTGRVGLVPGFLPSGSATLQASSGQSFRVDPSGAPRTYTLSTTGAQDGDLMFFYTGGGVGQAMQTNVTITSGIGGQGCQFNTGDTFQSALFIFDSGAWWLTMGVF